jgi:hypothetical protein
MLEKEDAKGGLFRIAKQMVKKNRDVVRRRLRERCGWDNGCGRGRDYGNMEEALREADE